MSKRLIDRFSEEYEKHLSNDRTREQSFELAKEEFEKVCGFTPYSSHNSFITSKGRDRKKKQK